MNTKGLVPSYSLMHPKFEHNLYHYVNVTKFQDKARALESIPKIWVVEKYSQTLLHALWISF